MLFVYFFIIKCLNVSEMGGMTQHLKQYIQIIFLEIDRHAIFTTYRILRILQGSQIV